MKIMILLWCKKSIPINCYKYDKYIEMGTCYIWMDIVQM